MKAQLLPPTRLSSAKQAGDPGLKVAITETTVTLCVEQYGNRLRAIVLTGSLARDEATFAKNAGGWEVLGDVEFLLVFQERAELPSDSALDSLRRKIEDTIAVSGLLCHVGLSPVHPSYLRRLPPSIFAYELRNCGWTVWGDSHILSLIRDFRRSDLPLEDAWRLLSNRIVELLEAVPEWIENPECGSRRMGYRAAKLYLDMATSFLVFQGAYEPSYRERAETLKALVKSASIGNDWPFASPEDFCDQVKRCTEFKLSRVDEGSLPANEPVPDLAFSREAAANARLLWRWELARLGGMQGQPSDRSLLRKWMQAQPLSKKLRGWLYVARKCGWHRSWRQWPRWFPRGLNASPRYWIYAAASELVFQFSNPCVQDVEPLLPSSGCEELLPWIPVPRPLDLAAVCTQPQTTLTRSEQRHGQAPSWQQVAAAVAWNYHAFVEGTRA